MKCLFKKLGFDLLFILIGLVQTLTLTYMIDNLYYFADNEFNLYHEVQSEIDFQIAGATFVNKYGQIKIKPYDLSIMTQNKITELRQLFIQLLFLIPIIPAVILLFYLTMVQLSMLAKRRKLCLGIIGLLFLGIIISVNWIKLQNQSFSVSEVFLSLIELIAIGIMLFFMATQSTFKAKYD